jgi:hypothetical protein
MQGTTQAVQATIIVIFHEKKLAGGLVHHTIYHVFCFLLPSLTSASFFFFPPSFCKKQLSVQKEYCLIMLPSIKMKQNKQEEKNEEEK